MIGGTMHPYRIFISYSHKDNELVKRIETELTKMGVKPIRDITVTEPGENWFEKIKEQIASAHFFVPVITKNSIDQQWLNQEIGYAIAIDVCMVPILVGVEPDKKGMLHEIQGLSCNLELKELQKIDFDKRLNSKPKRSLNPRIVADNPHDRTEFLVDYADRLAEENVFTTIRQSAFFSSFSIPAEKTGEPIWGKFDPHNRHKHLYMLRKERLSLERHVLEKNCSLILNPFTNPGEDVKTINERITRLGILIRFLKSLNDDQVTIVLSKDFSSRHITILGDWVLVKAALPRPGVNINETVFDRHARTVLNALKKFDASLQKVLADQKLRPQDSRNVAIDKLSSLKKCYKMVR